MPTIRDIEHTRRVLSRIQAEHNARKIATEERIERQMLRLCHSLDLKRKNK